MGQDDSFERAGGTTACPDESISCKHAAMRRACERRAPTGTEGGELMPSVPRCPSATAARGRGARCGEVMATSGSHRTQTLAGRDRCERSGYGRRPMGAFRIRAARAETGRRRTPESPSRRSGRSPACGDGASRLVRDMTVPEAQSPNVSVRLPPSCVPSCGRAAA